MDALDRIKTAFRPGEQGFLLRLMALAVAVALIVLTSGVAFAAELVTAELEGTTNDVSVTAGEKQNFTISISATGKLGCGDTAKATVADEFTLTKTADSTPVLTATGHSSELSFTGFGTGTGNCEVRWSGYPSPLTVAASITVGSNVPAADYTQVLGTAAGTTTVDNSGVDGAKLEDKTTTSLKFKVAAPTNSAPNISATNPAVTVNEGVQATNAGTWSDNGDVTITASRGTVAKNPNGIAGTWSWSETPGNETAAAGDTVTISATDAGNLSRSMTFQLIVNNVAPTTPGTPSVASGTSPSGTGAYTVSWDASADVAADAVTYSLEHTKGSGEWSAVAKRCGDHLLHLRRHERDRGRRELEVPGQGERRNRHERLLERVRRGPGRQDRSFDHGRRNRCRRQPACVG